MQAAVTSANVTRLLNKQFDQMLKPVINKQKGVKKIFPNQQQDEQEWCAHNCMKMFQDGTVR